MVSRREAFLQGGSAILSATNAPAVLRGIEVGAALVQSIEPPYTPAPEVTRYYPELMTLKPTSQERIQGTYRELTWFNYTNNAIDGKALKSIYEAVEGAIGLQASYTRDTQEIPFSLAHETNGNKHVLFILPQGTPQSTLEQQSYARIPNSALGAGTTGTGITFRDENTRISIVREVKSQGKTQLHHAIVTEACQGAIVVLNPQRRLDEVGQEVFCNSVGWAAALGSLENQVSYAKYLEARQSTLLHPTEPIRPIPLSQAIYEVLSVPVVK